MNLVLPFDSSVWGITIVLFVLSAIFYASLDTNGWKKEVQERTLQLWGSQFTESKYSMLCWSHEHNTTESTFFSHAFQEKLPKT